MSADCMAAGDQSGCTAVSRVAAPATCGEDIEVPEIAFQVPPSGSPTPYAAMMSTPGAVTSGVTTSIDGFGPRELNDACVPVHGLSRSNSAPLMLAVWSDPWSSHAFSVSPSAYVRCTPGTANGSAKRESALGSSFTWTMPPPPAAATASDLPTRASSPRAQPPSAPSQVSACQA